MEIQVWAVERVVTGVVSGTGAGVRKGENGRGIMKGWGLRVSGGEGVCGVWQGAPKALGD